MATIANKKEFTVRKCTWKEEEKVEFRSVELKKIKFSAQNYG
jgi:hypothetical protein